MTQPLSNLLVDDAVEKIRAHLATLERLNGARVEALSQGALRIAGSRVHQDGLISDPLDREVFKREAARWLSPAGRVLPLVISQELQLAFVGRKTHAPRPRIDHVFALKRLGSDQVTLAHHTYDGGLARCVRLTLAEEEAPWSDVSTLIAELRGVLGATIPSAEAYAAESLMHDATARYRARLLGVLRRWPEPKLPPTGLDYLSQTIAATPFWGTVLALSGYGDRADQLDLERLSHAPRVERTLAELKDRVWKAAPRLEKQATARFVAILTTLRLRTEHAQRAVSAVLTHALNTLVGELEFDADVRPRIAAHAPDAITLPFSVVFQLKEPIHSDVSLVLHPTTSSAPVLELEGTMTFTLGGEALELTSRFQGEELLRDAVLEAIEDEDTYYGPDWE